MRLSSHPFLGALKWKPRRVAPGGAEAGGSHLLIVLEGRLEAMLVCFGLSGTMLVTDPVFVEHLGHFFGDHVAIVLNGNERDFFSRLGHGLWGRSLGDLGGGSFWCLTHAGIIHHAGDEKESYSNASREEGSG